MDEALKQAIRQDIIDSFRNRLDGIEPQELIEAYEEVFREFTKLDEHGFSGFFKAV